MVLLKFHQRFKGHFLNELRVSFKNKKEFRSEKQVRLRNKLDKFLKLFPIRNQKNYDGIFLSMISKIKTARHTSELL